MVKNIIFDFGGVVIKHSANLIQEILSEMFPQNYKHVQDIWTEYRPLLNTGKKTSRDFLAKVKETIGDKRSTEVLENIWKTQYRKRAGIIDWNLLNLVVKLKRKYRVYLMTDTIDAHDYYNKTRDIYERFDGVYKSFEEGLWKGAGKKAFINILHKIKSKPNECVFIDDLESNVKIAQKVGIVGIVYKDIAQLRTQLITKMSIPGGVVHTVPKDLNIALTSDSKALALWEGLTPLARNEWICWVTFVKKDETRKDHVKRTLSELKEGMRRPCCWLGCTHRTDKSVSPSVRSVLSKRA